MEDVSGRERAAPEVQERIRDSFERHGLMHLLGARMDHIGAGRVHIVLPSRPEVTQQHGFVHAGATSAIADTAGGYAALTLFPEEGGGTHGGVQDQPAGASLGRSPRSRGNGPQVRTDADCVPAGEHTSVVIRPYEHLDAAVTLAVFISAVTETASADYTAEQVQAWAQPERRDVGTWHAAMLARNSIVATIGGELAGFSDVSSAGYVDMMFVSPRHQRRGVARQLLAHVEAHARSEGTLALSADASITARPFFGRHGFTVEAERHPVKAGVALTNYKMRKELR